MKPQDTISDIQAAIFDVKSFAIQIQPAWLMQLCKSGYWILPSYGDKTSLLPKADSIVTNSAFQSQTC